MSGNVFVINHPVLKHKLGYLRCKNTESNEFRNLLSEISGLLAFEATKELTYITRDVETPMGKAKVERIVDVPVIVSILRAGNPMLESLLSLMPFCQAGHIGIYRDKFINNTVEYYFKLPEDVKGKEILLVDPLLATGDTAVAAIDRLKQYEVGKIKFLSVLCSQKAIDKVHHFHNDVDIYTLGTNEELNDKGYLVPGIGDAGNRIYKTK
jgi:uracil phosphoribosyltransferase